MYIQNHSQHQLDGKETKPFPLRCGGRQAYWLFIHRTEDTLVREVRERNMKVPKVKVQISLFVNHIWFHNLYFLMYPYFFAQEHILNLITLSSPYAYSSESTDTSCIVFIVECGTLDLIHPMWLVCAASPTIFFVNLSCLYTHGLTLLGCPTTNIFQVCVSKPDCGYRICVRGVSSILCFQRGLGKGDKN